MIRLTRKGLPLLLPLIAVVVSYLPPLTSSPGTLAPARPAAAAIAPPPPRPRPRPSNLPPASFVPAPLQAALAAARGGHPTTLPSLDTPPSGLPAAANPESTAPFHPLALPSGVQGPLQPPTAQDIAAADQALAASAVATQARYAAPAAQGSAVRADATSPVAGLL